MTCLNEPSFDEAELLTFSSSGTGVCVSLRRDNYTVVVSEIIALSADPDLISNGRLLELMHEAAERYADLCGYELTGEWDNGEMSIRKKNP